MSLCEWRFLFGPLLVKPLRLPASLLLVLAGSLQAQDSAACVEILKRAPVYSPGLNLDEMPQINLEVGFPLAIFWHGELTSLDATGHAGSHAAVPKLPPEARGLKYRASQFWASQGDSVLAFVQARGEWVPRLLSKAPFRGFDITFDGRIVLFGTPTHMAEFYQPISSKPQSVIAYPVLDDLPESLKPADYPKFFWLNPVATVVDEYFVVYFPNLGRMYKVDLLKPTSEEVEVPWSRLETKAAAQEADEKGFISIIKRPTFNSIEFIPESTTSLRIAYQVSNAAYEMRPPPPDDPRPKIVETRPSTERGFYWFQVDLVNGTCSQVRDEPNRLLPQILSVDGKWANPKVMMDAGVDPPQALSNPIRAKATPSR